MQLERDVEGRLMVKAKRAGGRCVKLLSLHEEGLPDRLLLLPGGRAIFVETKRLTGKPSPMQRYQHRSLRKLGFRVYMPYTAEEVDRIFAEEEEANAVLTT